MAPAIVAIPYHFEGQALGASRLLDRPDRLVVNAEREQGETRVQFLEDITACGQWLGSEMVPRPGRDRKAAMDATRRARRPFDHGRTLDTCVYNKESLELLFKIAGADRCLFGTENPGAGTAIDPDTGAYLDDLRPVIESIDWLSTADKQKIFEQNALSLFSRVSVPAAAPS